MSAFSYERWRGQGPYVYPPTPRRKPEPLPATPLEDGPGARRDIAQEPPYWAPRPLTPPPPPRDPDVYHALHLAMVQVVLPAVAGAGRVELLPPARLDTTRAATFPELPRLVLRFQDLGARAPLARASGVTVGDVLAAVDGVLNARDSEAAASLRARFPGHRVLALRVEWAHGDVFNVVIGPGYTN